MMKKRPVYEPPRYMTNQQAAEQLIETIKSHEGTSKFVCCSLNFNVYFYLLPNLCRVG